MCIMTYPLGIREEDEIEFCQNGPLNQNFKWILRRGIHLLKIKIKLTSKGKKI